MAELLINKYLLLTFLFLFQLEFFFFLCYDQVIFFCKSLRLVSATRGSELREYNNHNSLILLFIILTLFSNKGTYTVITTLFVLILALLIYTLNKILQAFQLNQKNPSNKISLILSMFVGFFFIISHINNFLTFFFFIEIYGVLYYFIFLTSYSFSNYTLLNYKNGLLLLLWNNFLTTVFLALSCFYLLRQFGTTTFTELELLSTSCNYLYLFLIGLSWKLGLPVFHFFKLEIYKFLVKENVFFFSIITAIVNTFILFFTISISIVYSTIYLNNLILILLGLSLVLVIFNLKVYNILYFFALSSIVTMTTILSLFII